ncbi:MAG: sensor domain-containing diguanylate cyclase [Pseudomonadota bacterium]|nr:sensor domain-containing diguanylate cyclase [Pseudomonadota bacterium]
MSKLQNEHLEFFFEISIDLMCIAGADGYFKRVNPAFTKALGWTAEELLAEPFIEFVHPADRERTVNEVRRLASGIDTVCCFENRYRKKDGSWAWLGWTCPAATPENELLYAVARDISEQKKIQEHLVQLATYDSLTGLANRALFLDEAARAASRCNRTRTGMAVLYVDLDGFKHINDELGHDAGDAVLREAAQRIASCIRDGDLAARLGGDEFAAILQASTAYPGPVAQRMIEAIGQPLAVHGRTCQLSASIGLAISDVAPPLNRVEQLIKCADIAMYDAKRGGGNRYVVYAPRS